MFSAGIPKALCFLCCSYFATSLAGTDWHVARAPELYFAFGGWIAWLERAAGENGLDWLAVLVYKCPDTAQEVRIENRIEEENEGAFQ
ncbi:unnamed protein product [Gongylonema pulchrum]|uniref:DUF2958 domain-containing protein n=1 Tax=Gongylonema pulchrum TaxID=637853 RepID=A0A183EFS7_9BILA|nr:unnamed protein product [Gongylonema pulchrum]